MIDKILFNLLTLDGNETSLLNNKDKREWEGSNLLFDSKFQFVVLCGAKENRFCPKPDII